MPDEHEELIRAIRDLEGDIPTTQTVVNIEELITDLHMSSFDVDNLSDCVNRTNPVEAALVAFWAREQSVNGVFVGEMVEILEGDKSPEKAVLPVPTYNECKEIIKETGGDPSSYTVQTDFHKGYAGTVSQTGI